MRLKLIIAIITLANFTGVAQVDSTFWNPDMLNIAEAESVEGWVFIKPSEQKSLGNFLLTYKSAFLFGEDDQLELIKSETDNLGMTHHRYQHTYKGFKVEGSTVVLHEESSLISSVSGTLSHSLNKNLSIEISEQEALNIALEYLSAEVYGWEEHLDLLDEEEELEEGEELAYYSEYPTGELVLGLMNNNGSISSENYTVSYRFEITTVSPDFTEQAIYVNVATGEIDKIISLTQDLCNCCNGSTHTLFNGTRNVNSKENGFPFYNYLLQDNCRGGGIKSRHNRLKIRDANNTFRNSHREKVAGSAAWAAAETYDYFLSTFSRNSYDGSGAEIQLYTSRGSAGNASWNGTYFAFGNALPGTTTEDLVTLDVVGHEITHAVTDHSADLIYSYESGALNESFSDIMGSMVEFNALGVGNYLIGEDTWIPDGKLRDMEDPKSKNDPDTYGGTFWWTSSGDNGGVHTNSGVQNRWFYLLAEGGNGTNDLSFIYSVQGIGRAKAAAIAYRNLTVYLTSTSNYADARSGSIRSAMDLYGKCSNEVMQTMNAWNAVGVVSTGGVNTTVSVNCAKLNLFRNYGYSYTQWDLNNLQSNCNVNTNTNSQVTLYAGNTITLDPGFTVDGKFTAYIDPCLASIQLRRPSQNSGVQLANLEKLESEERTLAEEILIYPNPSNGIINMDIDKETFGNAQIRLFDINGKELPFEKRYINGKCTIDLSNEPKGIYLLNIVSQEYSISKKLIVN